MPSEGSVTNWIQELKRGDEQAAQKLWERYVGRLMDVARKKLGKSSKRVADEEDVAVDAFMNLWDGVRNGRFSKLNDRHDLWQVLVMLTDRRAVDQTRRADAREKIEVGESKIDPRPDHKSDRRGLDQFLDEQPTPEFALELAEQYQILLERLDDATLRQIAQWKVEAYTNEEIAQKLGVKTRTVERKLKTIRDLWQGRSKTG